MSQTTTEQIIAHAALLHAVDRLLENVKDVQEKRHALAKAMTAAADQPPAIHRKRGARQ